MWKKTGLSVDTDMDRVVLIIFGFFFGIFLLISTILNLLDWIEKKYQKYKWKKKRFYLSSYYIVGFPSGEIMYVDDRDLFHKLKKKKLLKWFSEYKCHCFKDCELNYIKKIILKNKN
jgi:hypothetical protein